MNEAIDAAMRLPQTLPPGGPQQRQRGADAPRLVTLVKNATGGDLRERAVVGLGATVLELPELSDPSEAATAAVLVGEAVEAVLPDPEVHTAGRWGVTLAPIAAGQTGFVAVTGLIKIRVDVSDAGQRAVAPIADVTTHAAGAADGAPIVWRALQAEDPGTGLQWALVNLGAGSG
ncbi:MAG TPA: hypothetical protein PJ982_13790, partial [Lacipirellulaceae bacterium]|nr:hypothetical protein [Lacipirellulaceae bacterium]